MTERESPYSKYRPLAKLGQGGMAQVLLALASGPVGFNKLVVIKEILEELADDPEFVAMFLDEARLAARLNHPNVVQTTEVGVEDRRYYLCMEYLEGQPLNRIFGRVPRTELTRGMMVRILIDTLTGLHYAHDVCDLDGTPLEVVHRDVSPHNVFLTYAGQVKVVDFGIAKAVSSSIKTQTGVLKGKVHYMAPEQAQGEKVDRRADIFSVGMMLWDVLGGRRPFQGLQDVAILHKIMLGDIPRPSTAAPDVPAALEAICMKALAHDREDRFATAAEMATALEEALFDLGERGSVRDAGKVIEARFADERERMKRVIEAQAAAMQHASAHPPAALPILTLDRSEITGREGRSVPGAAAQAASVREDGQSGSITGAFAGRSLAPPQPAPPRSARTAVLLGVGAFVLAGAVVTVSALRSQPTPAAPAPLAAQLPAPASTTHVISIDSMPQGATVSDGDLALGTTPMTLTLDVATTAERRLVMSLPGYAPHTFVPTAGDVRIQVPLAPLPTPQAVKPAKAAESPARPRPQARPDDIKMTR